MTLLVRMGSALLRPDPTVGGEQRELCGHGQDRREAGCYGGDNRHTVSPPVLHQARWTSEGAAEWLLLVCSQKTAERVCLWVNHPLITCKRGGRKAEGSRSEQQRAAVVEVAVDGSLDFLHMSSPGVEVLCITSHQHHYRTPGRRQIRHRCYMNSAGHFPRGALPGIEIMQTRPLGVSLFTAEQGGQRFLVSISKACCWY